MPNIKTAISIDESLFNKAKSLSREMKISRSKLFAIAIKEFILRRENRNLLEKINKAYSDGLEPDEKRLLSVMEYKHKSLVEEEW